MQAKRSLVVLGAVALVACKPSQPARESSGVVEVASASAPVASASAPGWQPATRPQTARGPRKPLDDCSPEAIDLATARQLFLEGTQAYQRGDLATAQALFERVYSQTCTPKVLYNIGVTREAQNDVEGAIEAFELYLQREPGSSRTSDVQDKLRVLNGRR